MSVNDADESVNVEVADVRLAVPAVSELVAAVRLGVAVVRVLAC